MNLSQSEQRLLRHVQEARKSRQKISPQEEPFQQEQKRAFTRAAFASIQDVLRVRPEQIRLIFEHIAPENGHVALLKEEREVSEQHLKQ